MSPLAEAVTYVSSLLIESEVMPGVQFTIAKVSLARRMEITRRMRALLDELEFRLADATVESRLKAGELEAAIDREYLNWGLLSVDGLLVDGAEPTVTQLLERGPEALCREIAAAIRRQCYLTGTERKN